MYQKSFGFALTLGELTAYSAPLAGCRGRGRKQKEETGGR